MQRGCGSLASRRKRGIRVIDRRRFVAFSVAFIALFTLTYDFRLVYLKNPRLRQFPHPGRSLPEHPLEFDRPVWGTSTRQAE